MSQIQHICWVILGSGPDAVAVSKGEVEKTCGCDPKKETGSRRFARREILEVR